jgi:lipoprotein NlpI
MFGLHPLHVESVAWVSERKDVLYSFFFLLSLILYTKYASCRKSIYYGFSLLFFLLSLLSKGQAVVLAAILPFIDYVVGRKWFSVKVLSEKIPFFILLLIFGWVAFRAQESSNALYFVHYSLPERFAFASFGLTQYLSKSILPIGLSAFYPYPLRLLNGSIPSYYWLFIVLLPGYLIGTYFLFKRSKFYAFGLGLFFLSIFPVLQIIPVGATIMADRYFYIPSVGLLLCIAVGLIEIRNITIRYVLFILFVFMFSCLSFSRCGIWKDSITLWDDVIKKYDYSIYAFYNRGTAYGDLGQWEKAIPDLSKAIEIDPNKTTAYYQRGVAYGKLGQWDKAIADYLKQTEISPNDIRVYVNCGAAYANLGQWGKAIVEYSRAIKIDSKNLGTYCNRGIAYGNLGLWEKAIADYSTVIDINPKYPDVYINRGNAYGNIGQWKEAIADYSRVIEIDPSNSIAYYDRGVGYTNIKQWDKAFADFSKATKIDPNFAKAVSNREIVYKMLNGEKK